MSYPAPFLAVLLSDLFAQTTLLPFVIKSLSGVWAVSLGSIALYILHQGVKFLLLVMRLQQLQLHFSILFWIRDGPWAVFVSSDWRKLLGAILCQFFCVEAESCLLSFEHALLDLLVVLPEELWLAFFFLFPSRLSFHHVLLLEIWILWLRLFLKPSKIFEVVCQLSLVYFIVKY